MPQDPPNGATAGSEKPEKQEVPEVPSGVTEEASLLAAFADVPTISGLNVQRLQGSSNGKQDLWATVTLAQRDFPANKQRKLQKHVLLPASGKPVIAPQLAEPADALLQCPAPSGKQAVAFKAGTDGATMALQIWSTGRCVTELQVPSPLHGPFVNDGYFASGATWSRDEQAVAYTAEVPPFEKTPAWGGPEAAKDYAAPKSWRGVGTVNEDWGELNTGKRPPGVYILDVARGKVVKASAGFDTPDISVGQPAWAPDGSGLVVAGWPHVNPDMPQMYRKLGVVFCYNRPCSLYFIPVSRNEQGELDVGSPKQITESNSSAHWPRFTPDGQQLVFLSHLAAVNTGTHNATATLRKLPWPSAKQSKSIVQPTMVVDVPREDARRLGSPRPFPGLYLTQLLDEPFAGSDILLLTSQWYCQTAVLAVNCSTGKLAPITPVDGQGASCSLAAVSGGRMFAIRACSSAGTQLLVADIPSDPQALLQGPSSVQWEVLQGCGSEIPEAAASKIAEVDCQVIEYASSKGPDMACECVCYIPKNKKGPCPTILAPHGGPHAAVTLGWYWPYTFLASLGYAVLMPNFRGSTGYGQAFLSALPGNAGSYDVQDCKDALDWAVKQGIADQSRVAVVGGSHGGFLSGHLMGQFPEAFRAGIMRNPVCNVSLMSGVSDIADWCFIEVFGCEEGRKRMSPVAKPADLEAMFAASPVAHVHKVKADVLLLLGAKDRRVPYPDGMQYQSALRAAGVHVRTILFPEDTHSLSLPRTEFEQWINAVFWLKHSGLEA